MNSRFILFILIVISPLAGWAQSHKGISFQGVIKNPDGTYPNVVGTSATLKVLSPNNCVLWEEQHLGVNVTDGYVNLVVGKGTTGGYQPAGQTFPNVFNNTSVQSSLTCLNFDGTVNALSTTYTPTSQDARKLRLEMSLPSGPLAADFNLRSMPFAVLAENAESAKKVGTKSESDLLAVNSGVGLTQSRLEEFIQSLTTTSGKSVLWDGTHFAAYDPTSGANLSAGSVTDTAIGSVSWSKLTSVPSPLSEFGALSCIDGKIIKKVSGAWACADESGLGAESDPTVQAYAKSAPGTGLSVNGSNQIVPDFGTAAGKVVQGNDSRLSDARVPSGSANGDLSGSYPDPAVAAIKGKSVTYASLATGDFLKYDGSGWVNSVLSTASLSDAGDLLKASNMPGTCSATQTLTFSSPTGTWVCSNIAGLDGGVITTGTIDASRLPASVQYWTSATGGINYAGGKVGIGTTAPGAALEVAGQVKITGGTPGPGKVLTSDAAGLATWEPASGGGGTPGGATTQVQFNDSGAFGGSPLLIWDNTASALGIGGAPASTKLTVLDTRANTASGLVSSNVFAQMINPPSTSVTPLVNGNFQSMTQGTSDVGSIFGVEGLILHYTPATMAQGLGVGGSVSNGSTGTITTGIAGSFSISNSSTGAISSARALEATVQNSSGGTMTTAYGLKTSVSSSGGAIGTSYGLYVGSVTGTTNYAIYSQDATAKTYLAGNVGIGTSVPSAKLEVNGQIVSKSFDNSASLTFDFSKGNVQYTTASCGAMTLSNMVDGGSYVVAVLGTTAGTCSFSHTGLTFVSNYTGPTTDGTRSLVSFQRVGTYVFVNWNTGYQ